jgi:hypothetical protein
LPIASKEFILNYAMNRWGLNKKTNVGPTSESIRRCRPNSLEEWERYYFSNVRSREHVIGLGRRLHENIANVVANEVRFHPQLLESISEEDCINYMIDFLTRKTYEGYRREFG